MSHSPAQRSPLQLSLTGITPSCKLESSLNSIKKNKLYSQVISCGAFERLKGVSFLGAIDYLPNFRRLLKPQRTRYSHSLNVATLAQLVALKRGYNVELANHLVIAGLLHDIGHPPLSHSVEPFLKEKFGFGHHEMGEMLLNGEVSLGKELNSILRKNVDIEFIKRLINGEVRQVDGGDLFSSKINLDTIDGIIRSYSYLKPYSKPLNPETVALASFISTDEDKYQVLDRFWELKHTIYNYLITSGDGLLADLFSQQSIREGRSQLVTEDLFKSECSWQQKFSGVFASIYDINLNSHYAEPNPARHLSYIKRKYYINSNKLEVNQRYLYTKKTSFYNEVR